MQDHERLARATWYRCRSLSERKEGATWESISSEYRQAWIDGTIADLEAAQVCVTHNERLRIAKQ